MTRLLTAAAAAGICVLAMPVAAQKSADTLRVGFIDPIATIEVAIDPKPETIMTTYAVFDGLVWYDPRAREYRPALAESWTRIGDRTVEFKLKRGIKFHDGSEFTADDVVYTYQWLTDPNSKLRFVPLEFVERTEKIDDYTVRVIEKRPTAWDLARFDTAIYPAAIHSKLADKSEFGRKAPIGTGPYKVESVDSTKGIVLTRHEGYQLAQPWRPAGGAKRIVILPIPEMQTQVAQLMTGGLDLIHDVPKDLAEPLGANPALALTATPGPNYFFMSIDSAKRTPNVALANPNVRKALQMAIDRNLLAKTVVTGGDQVVVVNSLCVPQQADCPTELDAYPPTPDQAAARRLLSEAGYPNGLDVDITSYPGAFEIAEAVAGELRKIGVRASVAKLTLGAYRDKQAKNLQEILVGHFWSPAASPNGSFESFFADTPRNYTRDPKMWDFYLQAAQALDQKNRITVFRQAFSYLNANYYIMPLTNFPTVLAHTKDVVVGTGAMNPAGIDLNRITWK
jgi:peptide/nickel transport system substrate-binding protein